MQTTNLLFFGYDSAPPEPISLRAGPLIASFDPDTLFLRRIALGEREVIRAIYAAVRDQNWSTVPGRMQNLRQEIGAQSFKLEFDVECHQEPIRFRWHGIYSGTEDGTITCEFSGCAESTFLRNRIGFCVLHPIKECAGAPAEAEHEDGTLEALKFPELIEPQIIGKASFHDLRSIAHEIQPGTWAKVCFEGDTFETEDQRNWTDASYKTYCTPLANPFPVQIPAGTRIHQKVVLTLKSINALMPKISEDHPVEFTLPEQPTAVLPQIGTSLPSADVDFTSELKPFRSLNLSHLRADLRLGNPGWRKVLRLAADVGRRLDLPLELALHLREGSGVTDLVSELRQHPLPLKRFLIFREGEAATRRATIELARTALSRFAVPIGGGTDAHFCELNRERALGHFEPAAADFISWPITPQVHAFDYLSLMENLEAQAETVKTARQFSGSAPLLISPVTLRPRFNAVATTSSLDEPVPEADPRQHSHFAAAWTLGTIASLTSAGVHSVTLYELFGPRGLAPSSSFDDSSPPPLVAILRALPRGCQVYPCLLSNHSALVGVYEGDRLKRVAVTNLQARNADILIRHSCTNHASSTRIPGTGGEKITEIDHGEIRLQAPPYACCILEF